jgi:hypothetical protein
MTNLIIIFYLLFKEFFNWVLLRGEVLEYLLDTIIFIVQKLRHIFNPYDNS